jgi:hypothetical protein
MEFVLRQEEDRALSLRFSRETLAKRLIAADPQDALQFEEMKRWQTWAQKHQNNQILSVRIKKRSSADPDTKRNAEEVKKMIVVEYTAKTCDENNSGCPN